MARKVYFLLYASLRTWFVLNLVLGLLFDKFSSQLTQLLTKHNTLCMLMTKRKICWTWLTMVELSKKIWWILEFNQCISQKAWGIWKNSMNSRNVILKKRSEDVRSLNAGFFTVAWKVCVHFMRKFNFEFSLVLAAHLKSRMKRRERCDENPDSSEIF